jgi:hypothetical protein
VARTRGKPVQGGVRVKLSKGVTWQQLAELCPPRSSGANY